MVTVAMKLTDTCSLEEKLFSIHMQGSKNLSTEENIVNTAALLMTATPETIQMSINDRK